jgi:hypothetical protein
MVAALPSTSSNITIADVHRPAICWISDVVASEKGVRIYFRRKGGPLFVSLPDGFLSPSDAPIDAARPEDAAVEVRLGDKLAPTNSPEDGCSLVVVNRDGQIGVEASAFFNPPGLPSQLKTEFIPAHQ